jgi:hypothetical protein
MNSDSGKEKFEVFSVLTEKLQSYMRSNKVDKALKVAQERHCVLVSLLEGAALMGFERSEYAMKALAFIDQEQKFIKISASENRSDFVSRRNAFKAYGTGPA